MGLKLQKGRAAGKIVLDERGRKNCRNIARIRGAISIDRVGKKIKKKKYTKRFAYQE